MAWAKLLGHDEALKLLEANEREEKAADMKLSRIAESEVNPEAAGAVENQMKRGSGAETSR